MKASKFIVSLVISAGGFLSFGQAIAQASQPSALVVQPSAAALLTAAEARAAKEHKNVFLIFHASWCIWCLRFDDLLNDPTLKPFFDKNYVIVHIDCLETGAKTSMNSAGWKSMMDTYGATGQGIPYWLFLDPAGKVIATCRSPFDPDPKGQPGNLGFPDNSQPKDLTYFVGLIQKSAPQYDTSFESNFRAYLKSLSY